MSKENEEPTLKRCETCKGSGLLENKKGGERPNCPDCNGFGQIEVK